MRLTHIPSGASCTFHGVYTVEMQRNFTSLDYGEVYIRQGPSAAQLLLSTSHLSC